MNHECDCGFYGHTKTKSQHAKDRLGDRARCVTCKEPWPCKWVGPALPPRTSRKEWKAIAEAYHARMIYHDAPCNTGSYEPCVCGLRELGDRYVAAVSADIASGATS